MLGARGSCVQCMRVINILAICQGSFRKGKVWDPLGCCVESCGLGLCFLADLWIGPE